MTVHDAHGTFGKPDSLTYETSREHDDTRQTNLLRDVAFNRHGMNDGHHVSPYDNGKIQVGTDGIIVKLTQGINEDAFKRTLSSATRATIGLDLSVPGAGEWEPCASVVYPAHAYFEDGKLWQQDPRDPGHSIPVKMDCDHVAHRSGGLVRHGDWEGQVGYGADWEEMLKGGLQTALETQVIVFEVQGVSRTCTHQIVRTRNAAFHQQSQRAGFYGNQPEARMPESVWLNMRARGAWMAAKAASDNAYRVACEEDISYQDARYALLEGTDNYIMCEYTVREFLNVFAYRGCSMFSWEIVYVMREMRRLLIEAHPWLEPHIKISCEKTGGKCTNCKDGIVPGGSQVCWVCDGEGNIGKKCTFQGWEQVEGQCDFPWAKEANRTFISKGHAIKRRPGMNAISEGPVPGMKPATPITKGCGKWAHREPHGAHEWYDGQAMRVQCQGYEKESPKR